MPVNPPNTQFSTFKVPMFPMDIRRRPGTVGRADLPYIELCAIFFENPVRSIDNN
jgi:hypothetical protein